MAFALNASHPLAGNVVSLIGIDEDGVTIRDFADAGRTCTKHANATYGSGSYGVHVTCPHASPNVYGIEINPPIPHRTPTQPAGTVLFVVNGGYGLSNVYGRHDSRSMFGTATYVGNNNYLSLAINKGNVATAPFGIGYNSSPVISFSSTTSYSDASGDVPTTFTVSTETNQDSIFYYNGVADGSGTLPAVAATNSISYIGGHQSGGRNGLETDFVWLVVFDRVLTPTEILDLHNSLGASQQFALIGPGGTGAAITVDDPSEPYLVLDGTAGSASYTISGTYTGDDDTIEYRVLMHGTQTEVSTWATLTAATGGTYSQSVTLPRGGWYNIEVRKAADTPTSTRSTGPFCVGLKFGLLGQSHGANLLTSGTGTPDGRAVVHDGTNFSLMSTAGVGRIAMLADMIAAFDCPICLIADAVSGTSIAYWYTSGGGKTANYDAWEAKVTAAGGSLSGFIWWQGDFNTQTGDTKATYKTEMDALFAQLRTDYGAGLPIVVVALGRKLGGPDTAWEAIRDAHVDAGDDAGNYIVTTIDLEQQGDGQHFTDTGTTVAAHRIAQCVLEAYGEATYSRGPTISSAYKISNTVVEVIIAHDGGADISPATGITGFAAYDGATPVAITSAVRYAANKVRLTLASAVTGDVTLRYGYGAYPDMTAPLRDDTALALPLQSTDADVTAATIVRNVVLSMIDREGGAAVANAAGLRWAFFDDPLPESFVAPSVVGTGASTDGTGALTISVVGTSRAVGEVGFLVLSDTDGTLADCNAFAAPVQVSG